MMLDFIVILLLSVFLFVDDVYTCRSQCGGNDVFPVELLIQAKAGRQCSHHRDERVVDGHLAHWIAGKEFVVQDKTQCGDAHKQGKYYHSLPVDLWQCGAEQERGNKQEQSSEGKAVARSHEHIHTLDQTSRQQARHGRTKGIDDNHAIAQQGEPSAFLSTKVQCQDAGKSYSATHHLAYGEAVALEEYACHDDKRKDTERIQYSRPCPGTVRQTYVEGGIVERGVHQRKDQHEPPVTALPHGKGSPHGLCHGQDYKARHGEAQACKEYLVARHLWRDGKVFEPQLYQRICPSPHHGRRHGKARHPHGALEQGEYRRPSLPNSAILSGNNLCLHFYPFAMQRYD